MSRDSLEGVRSGSSSRPRAVRLLVPLLFVVVAAAVVAATGSAQETWVPLFDGKTLQGWEGDAGVFRVEEDVIVAGSSTAPTPRNEFLCTTTEYGDFVLRLEFQMPGDGLNAGVQIRSQRIPDSYEVIGYQADMGDGWWGALYDESRRNRLLAKPAPEVIARALHKEAWNQYAIYARGPRVRLFLNGHLTVDYTEDDAAIVPRGRICLQIHGGPPGEVRYREVEIRELPHREPMAATASDTVRFRTHVLTPRFVAEGIAVADVNRDGRTDVMAGPYWFEGGSWQPREMRRPRRFLIHREYSDAFLTYPIDVDADGWVDVVHFGFPSQDVGWFANPGTGAGPWKRRPIHWAVASETPLAEDLDGDGRTDLLFVDRESGRMTWMAPPGRGADAPWTSHTVSAPMKPERVERLAHGLGFGDMDGDRRPDIFTTDAWWRAPQQADGEWTEHAASLGEPAAHMLACDVDGDGDADVVSSSAHDYGVWWHEQVRDPAGKTTWKTHTIDDRLSQTHALAVADLNGDGIMDLVTGKRFLAHLGNDRGEYDPSLLVWYEGGRDASGKPTWTPRLVHEDAGAGLQVLVVDVTGDGRADILTASKKGVYVFERLP